MGYKILDVKADIHEDVESYLEKCDALEWGKIGEVTEGVLDIVDKHFEKIER